MKTVSEKISFGDSLTLQSGEILTGFELMTETYGELNSEKTNAVLVCHAFSGNHNAAGIKDGEKKPGWWDEIIGDGKTIDTTKFFVVSLNNIGGCHGSTGPTTIAAESGQPYGADFPEVSVSDWVETQKLLADHFGINCWEMVAGGSLGGMQALQWAISYPDKIKKAAIIAASSKISTQNIALNEVAREIIKKDENFYNGDYLARGESPKKGLKAARMLGHITYLSESNMSKRFGRKLQDPENKIDADINYEVENYLQYKGEQFAKTFDANSYILMTKAMDSFDPAKDFDNDLVSCLQNIQAKLLIASFDSDWLFPKEYGLDIQMSAIKAGVDSTYIELDGDYGHDSFLFYKDQYAAALKNFLNSNG
ncbi:MAG: homoserine O-acetyltransferase [Gammaproteobacteria bacterium]